MIELVRHIAGSHSYGTNVESSDIDVRGVYVAKPEHIRTPFFKDQGDELILQDEEDGKSFELNKFMSMIMECNPNAVETLWVDPKDITFRNKHYDLLRSRREDFLSVKIVNSLSGYAFSQLKHMKSREKWINNPQPVIAPMQYEYVKMVQNFTTNKIMPRDFNILNHNEGYLLFRYSGEIFGLYKSANTKHKVVASNGSLIVHNRSPENRISPDFIVKFNKDKYKAAHLNHSNYWTWRNNRNEIRSKMEEESGFDRKNALHLIRLLKMGHEVISTGKVLVDRPDAQELIDIRNGKYTYDEIIEWSTHLDSEINFILQSGNHPLRPFPNYPLAVTTIMQIQNECWEI